MSNHTISIENRSNVKFYYVVKYPENKQKRCVFPGKSEVDTHRGPRYPHRYIQTLSGIKVELFDAYESDTDYERNASIIEERVNVDGLSFEINHNCHHSTTEVVVTNQ